jgi:hypothetical protein
MKTVAVLLSLVTFSCLVLADDRDVIVITGEKAIKAHPKAIVRVTGVGPSGRDISVKIKGPGKLVNTNSVTRFQNGSASNGSSIKEFEVVLESAGVVEIAVTGSDKLDEKTKKSSTATYTINVGNRSPDFLKTGAAARGPSS